ncbi:McrC family protein [Deferribacter thermophilus]|uniref:McrC family protein n=1 Tax=Deferribacter thermophilus TaxID=53573 RepID=UPI003C2792C0
MDNVLQVIEYEIINIEKINSVVKNSVQAQKIFKELELFAQDNKNRFLVYERNGALKPQNFVGVIQTKSGFVIEILPKISNKNDVELSKTILIKMLKELKNSPFHYFQSAYLSTENMPLLEIFISMFLTEIEHLIKKGIKCDYITHTQNQKFLKGKLKIKEQINKNFIHKERFFVEYDEYHSNRIENQILKTALMKLYSLSKLSGNQQRIRKALFIFDDIDIILNDPKIAFTKIKKDRTISHYHTSLVWAKLFLLNEIFTPYKGSSVAYALLFDMNKIFEEYVGRLIKKELCNNVKLQDKQHYLFDEPKKFSLIPDIVINEGLIILDTKWKLIGDVDDISQTDLYQIFVYAAKYKDCKKIGLIFPCIEERRFTKMTFKIGEERVVQFYQSFFNLNSKSINDALSPKLQDLINEKF